MILFYRLLFYLVGLIVLTFGVSLTIKADVGTASWDALNIALSENVGLTIGSWVIIIGITLIVVNSIMLKTKPDILAIIPNFIIGMMIDFWMLMVFKDFHPDLIAQKVLLFGIGIFIIALGVALYLQPNFSVNPIDNLMVAIHSRLKVNLMAAKTIGEVLALLFALLLQGPIGFGTLVFTFSIGPCIGLFHPYFEKLLTRLILSHA